MAVPAPKRASPTAKARPRRDARERVGTNFPGEGTECTCAAASVELRARLLHDLGPACLLRGDELPELLGRLRTRLRAGLLEAVLHLRRGEKVGEVFVQLLHDPGRRLRRGDDALERAGLEAGEA